MKIDWYDLLKKYVISGILKLSGMKAWVANVILKKIYDAIVKAWAQAMRKLEDNKELNKYKDTMSKGKDADEQQKIDDQLDLINNNHN